MELDKRNLSEKLKNEQSELEIKIQKLKDLLNSDDLLRIDVDHRILLYSQLDVMSEYRDILQKRITLLISSLI